MEGLLQDEAGLGHGAFEGVDEEEDAVGHFEDAFDFAAEVGVAGGVDDVDFAGDAGGIGVGHGDVFGEDGDAAFAFEGVVVEDEVVGHRPVSGTCRTGGAWHRRGWFCRDRRGQ